MLTPIPSLNSPESVSVLLISPFAGAYESLRYILHHSNWLIHEVSTCRDALAYACENKTAVAICERDLPDGDWRLLLSKFETLPLPPNLIVTSRMVDEELWAEVLNLGGYDVLVQPFDSDEVYRAVFLAWHEHKSRCRKAAVI